MLDKSRLHALLAGAVVALLLMAMHMVPVLFAEPPNTRRVIAQALINKGLAMIAAWFAAYFSAPWAADMINGIIGVLPWKLGFKVDPIAAAAAVAIVTMTLIADPSKRLQLVAFIRSLIPKGAS